MIHALTLILLCQLLGEGIIRALGLPVPGPVLGMALLFLAMLAVPRVAATVVPVGEGILRHLSLLFVPAGVGVIGHVPVLASHGAGLGLALVVSTALALAVGAGVFVAVSRLIGGGTDD